MIVDAILGHDAEPVWRLIRVLALLLSLWEWRDSIADLRKQFQNRDDKLQLMLAKWRFAHDFFMVALTGTWMVTFWWASRLHHGPAQDILFLTQNVLVAMLIMQTIYLLRIRWMIGARRA